MWPPTQEVPKLLSASNWKHVTGEVLLNKTVYCYSLRGLIYSLRVLVIEHLSRKHGGGGDALCPQPCFPGVFCVSLGDECLPWSLRKEHPNEERTWPGYPGYTFHAVPTCNVLDPDCYHCPPTRWVSLLTQLSSPTTGMTLPCGANQTHHPLPNVQILQ